MQFSFVTCMTMVVTSVIFRLVRFAIKKIAKMEDPKTFKTWQ